MSSYPSRGVLVTGSSRGVGAAVAHAFAARGDRVVVHYLGSEAAAHEVCRSLPGDGHAVVQADLADPDAVQRLAAEADLTAEAAALVLPVTIVHGDRDASAPLELTGRRYATIVPGARLIVYEGVAHAIMVTHAARLAGEILRVAREGDG